MAGEGQWTRPGPSWKEGWTLRPEGFGRPTCIGKQRRPSHNMRLPVPRPIGRFTQTAQVQREPGIDVRNHRWSRSGGREAGAASATKERYQQFILSMRGPAGVGEETQNLVQGQPYR